MNAMIEAISNSVSALPAAAVGAQAATGQRGTGGFALTLAAAQGLAASSPAPSSQDERATGMPAGSTTALAAKLNVSGVAAPQRKPSSGSSGGISGNNVVPASLPMTASPVQWLAPPTSPPLSLAASAWVNDPGVAEATVRASAETASNTAGLNTPVSGAVSGVGARSDGLISDGSYKQPGSQATSGNVASFAFSLPVASAAPVAVAANVAVEAEPGNVRQNDARQNNAPQNNAPQNNVLQSNVPQNHVEFGLPVEAMGPSGGTQPSPLRLAAAQPSPGAISPSVIPNLAPNGTPQIQSGISRAGSFGWRAAEPTSQTSPAVEPATPASVRAATAFSEPDSSSALPASSGASLQVAQANVTDDGSPDPAFQTVLSTATVEPTTSASISASIRGATVFSEPGREVTLLASSGTNLRTAPEDVTNAGMADHASQGVFPATAAGPTAPQTSSPAEMGTGNPLSAIVGAQNPASIANLLSSAVASRVAVARAAVEATAVSVHGARPDAAATLAPASSAGSNSSNGPVVAAQTPFAVFFSGPGAGTESAASVLPRMILPATSSAMHNGYGTTTATGAAPQSGGLSGSVVQNVTLQPGKGSQSGSQSDGAPAGTALRRDDPGTANSAAVSAQSQASSSQTSSSQSSSTQALPAAALPSATAAPIAPPAAVAVVPPLSAPPAPADSAPKPATLPAAAGSAASAAAAAQPVALPGPVQVAQMVNRVGQSEMRIGLNTSAFGSVEVRTVVRSSDVGLLIGSEKGDLRGLMTNEMPALTNTLQQQNLRLNSVNFMPGFGYSNNGSGGGGDSQQRSFVPQPALASAGSGLLENSASDSMEIPLPEAFARAGSSLSILA